MSAIDLKATAVNEDETAGNSFEAKIKALKKQSDALHAIYRAGFDRYRAWNKLYSEKKISYSAYLDSGKNFNQIQDSISKMERAISDEVSDLNDLQHADGDIERQIQNLAGSNSKSYSSICTAVDTFNGKWYGLLDGEELEKAETRFRYRNIYKETARNRFYIATVSIKDSSRKAVELLIAEPEKMNDAVYLQGGFLLNKATALPIHLKNDEGFIVCYKEKVGYTSNVILSGIDLKGNNKWTINTMLPEFKDWIYTGTKLIILGNDNKEISSSNANLLLIIDLQNGKAVKHDYFTEKMR